MSRFKQPERALAPLPPAQLGKAAPTLYAEEPAIAEAPATAAPVAAAPPSAGPRWEESKASKIGMLAVCGVILSPYIQDFTERLGFRPFLSIVCFLILPFAFLASGQMARALRSGIGKAWLGFAFFAVLAVPFSTWRSDSLRLMWGYVSEDLSLFFFMCAFATSYRLCRWFITTQLICAVLLLINSAAFGQYNNIGRMFLPGSYLFENSNDLALVLLIDIGYFYYLVLRPGYFTRALGAAGMLACLYFVLKTGSRGGFLALGVFLVVLFLFSQNKLIWTAVALPIVAVTLLLTPGDLLHRLTLILADPDPSQAQSGSDAAAIESQQERQMLIKKAVRYTIANPLLGVGPGEFGTAVWEDEHKAGKHSVALGTHNTYLEVSSECGLPAFCCYVAVVLGCIRVNYKGVRRLRQRPDLVDAARLSYCLLAISAGFAVSIFFHHLTYAIYLPLLSGLTACTAMSARSFSGGPRIKGMQA